MPVVISRLIDIYKTLSKLMNLAPDCLEATVSLKQQLDVIFSLFDDSSKPLTFFCLVLDLSV